MTKRSSYLTLAAVVVLPPLALLRFSVQPLGWVVLAPALALVYQGGGKKRHLWVLGALLAGYHLATAKIVTPPLSYPFVPLYAVPLALAAFASVALAGLVWRRLHERMGLYVFPCAVATMEAAQYTLTELGSWGALAHSQTSNLALLQVASIFGPAGVSWLVALGSSLAAAIWVRGAAAFKRDAFLFLALVAAAHLYGERRLASRVDGPKLRVAAVSSPFESAETRQALKDSSWARARDRILFERTALAADRGAKLVVWNEATTMLAPSEEPAFFEQGRKLAMKRKLDLVMAYAVLVSTEPLRFENKYRWVRPDGTTADDYWKRHPVPGEGSIPGGRSAAVLEFPEGRVSGAICYDYDFPGLAQELAASGAGLVALPSSDWYGIDPLHSDMARLHGLAAGTAVFRSVRSATSFASDSYGRVLAAMRFGEGDGVMVADVPAQGVPTLFARLGDWFAVVCAFVTAAFLLLAGAFSLVAPGNSGV